MCYSVQKSSSGSDFEAQWHPGTVARSHNHGTAALSSGLGNAADPAMWIGGAAALYIDQCGAQPIGLLAGAAIPDHKITVARLDRADRGQHCGSAAGEGFLEPAARS